MTNKDVFHRIDRSWDNKIKLNSFILHFIRMFQRLFFIVMMALMLPVMPLSAAQVIVPSETGNVIISGANDDVYTAGGTVTVNNTLSGDLFVAGGSVNVIGNVTQDVFAVGGNVSVLERVDGDVRVAGGNVVFNAPVTEDMMVAGGTVSLGKNARIGRDLWAAAGSLVVHSEIGGDAMLAGGEVMINGKIAGDVDVQAEKLVFGPQALVTGKVSYRGEQEAIIEPGAVVSPIEFARIPVRSTLRASSSAFSVIGFLVRLVALLIVGLLLWKVFGKIIEPMLVTAHESPWKSFGIGLVGVILIPILIVILFITVVGYYLASMLTLWFILALFVACAVAALFFGCLLLKWVKKTPHLVLNWQAVLLGVIVFSLVGLLPIVGWLIDALLILTVFGAMLQTAKQRIIEFS